jgi:hypothetical protein
VQTFSGGGPVGAPNTIVAFRDALGPMPAVGGPHTGTPDGRREVDWDSLPDTFASPNAMPGDVFNAISPRGLVVSTPGTELRVSADASNPSAAAPAFRDLRAAYGSQFAPYSGERAMAPLGSNVVDIRFRVAGTDQPAVVRGFGAMLVGVDAAGVTRVTARDRDGQVVAEADAPNVGSAFVGFADTAAAPRIAHVRIVLGDRAMGAAEIAGGDVVALDDVVYGEPTPMPSLAPAAASQAPAPAEPPAAPEPPVEEGPAAAQPPVAPPAPLPMTSATAAQRIVRMQVRGRRVAYGQAAAGHVRFAVYRRQQGRYQRVWRRVAYAPAGYHRLRLPRLGYGRYRVVVGAVGSDAAVTRRFDIG